MSFDIAMVLIYLLMIGMWAFAFRFCVKLFVVSMRDGSNWGMFFQGTYVCLCIAWIIYNAYKLISLFL